MYLLNMTQKVIDTLLGYVLLILFVLVFVIVLYSLQVEKESSLISCEEQCETYNMDFLQSEKSSYVSYDCFCVDSDGKPRQVPNKKK